MDDEKDIENELNQKLLHKDNFNLDDAVKAAGPFNYYQIYSVFFLCIVWIVVPSIPIMIPFFRMVPESLCLDPATNNFHKCSTLEYCDNDIQKINENEKLKNWETDFHINCENSFYYGLLASVYFLGVIIGFLFISNYSNKYGRRNTLYFFLCSYFIISLLILTYSTLTFLFFYMFLIGVIYAGTTMCAFVLIFESTTRENKTAITTIISMSFSFGALMNITFFYFLLNWKYLVGISSFLSLVLIFASKNIKESPELLNNKRLYGELKEVLEFIAKQNNRKEELSIYLNSHNFKTKENLNNKIENESKNNLGVWDVLQIPQERLKLIVMSLNFLVMSLTFYGINFNLNNFRLDSFLTGFMVYLSEIVAQMLSMVMVFKIGDKNSILLCFILSGISLIWLNFALFKENGIVLSTVLIILGKFGISSINNLNYIYAARIFPVNVRMGSISLCKIVSRLGAVSSTLIIEVTSYSMGIFGSLCLVVSALIWINEEKLEKLIDEEEMHL